MLQSFLGYFRKAAALDFYVEICQETAAFDASVRSTLPLMLGKAYFYDNNFDLAILQLKRSLQERETAEAHRYLAEIAIKKRDWDTAELESQRATVLDPGNRHFHTLFVRSLLAQEKYQSALEAVTRAIQEVKPPVPGFYNMQAQLHWKLEDYSAAIQAWETAKSIAPQNAYYPGQIARAYKILEDYNSAERYYLAALELKPADKKLQQELAEVRKLNGQ
jgi:tetratricopeptide (TPR) repeat protein